MGVIHLLPTFSAADLDDIYQTFGRALSAGFASHWERSRPDDRMADILALVDCEGLAVFTVVRTREGYASYDEAGRTLATGRTVGPVLAPLGRFGYRLAG